MLENWSAGAEITNVNLLNIKHTFSAISYSIAVLVIIDLLGSLYRLLMREDLVHNNLDLPWRSTPTLSMFAILNHWSLPVHVLPPSFQFVRLEIECTRTPDLPLRSTNPPSLPSLIIIQYCGSWIAPAISMCKEPPQSVCVRNRFQLTYPMCSNTPSLLSLNCGPCYYWFMLQSLIIVSFSSHCKSNS